MPDNQQFKKALLSLGISQDLLTFDGQEPIYQHLYHRLRKAMRGYLPLEVIDS